MFRKLYYLLPPPLRYLSRRILYFPQDLLASFNNELVPPRGLIYTGSRDFIQQGKDWKDFFIQYGHLQTDHSVLDIGSGIGRIALGLLPFLKGQYEGFDAVKMGVDWCAKHISSRKNNFNFRFIDLFNDLYKSKGQAASHFKFPYPVHSFDFVCAISVFTHMLPDEVDNYLIQIKNVLKPDGHAVFTFFILDNESISYMNTCKDGIRFDHIRDQRYAVMDHKVLAANVAYHRSYLLELFAQQGWTILHDFKGRWCGRPGNHALAFQDILVIKQQG